MKFLESIALDFHNEYQGRIRELCFVFPNKRSALFFKKYLSAQVDKPLFSPHITTFKELVLSLSDIREADRPQLLFDLYDTYRELLPSGESFDDFLYWGEIILGDFNDTDKYLANAKQLFSNVKELKQIESDYSFLSPSQLAAVKRFWEGFLAEGSSETKESFLKTWEILYPLYKAFNRKLETKGCAYEGAIYRKVATMDNIADKLADYREVVFVGFNALNKCERDIMKKVQQAGIADFYWDYDREFMKDKENKASWFANENLSAFPSKRKYGLAAVPVGKPSVNVIGAASLVMQAKIAGELLKDFPGSEESAVVLPDESLLMPLLGSVPPNIESINVTMGYPLLGTPLVSLVRMVAQMEWDQRGIYFKKVLPLLNHSFVHKIAGEEAREVASRIKRENRVYVPGSYFDGSEVLSLLFSKAGGDDPQQELCDKLLKLLSMFAASNKSDKIEREFIFHIQNALTRIKGILIPMNIKSFGRVLSMITEGISIPFSGEPLAGLQVMGVLETRALDFENLVIFSVNEGVFPKKNPSNSFIPYNLRAGFGLPVKEHEDALYTYLFYSLISRAKNVTLIYDTRTDGLKSGEPSRFILQLKYLYHMVAKESVVNYRIEPHNHKGIVVGKDPTVMERMASLFLGGDGKALSASALNNYIDCPLKFYFSQVEGLEASEDVEEGVEANEFGSIFHFAMEQLYKPFLGKRVTVNDIGVMLSGKEQMESFVDMGFAKYKNMERPVGYALLVKKMIVKYMEITLGYDKSIAPFVYLESEKRVKGSVTLQNGVMVPLKGFIDRLDKTSAMRIVDYKTGSGDLKYSGVESLFDGTKTNRNKVVFQMFMYALLLGESQEMIAEPYFIRELAKGKSYSEFIAGEKLYEYTDRLKTLLEEVFDTKVPFSPTSNTRICEWCDFNTICY